MQLLIQFISIIVTILLSAIATFLILKTISLFTSLRVKENDEDEGLDIVQHGENAYSDLNSVDEAII